MSDDGVMGGRQAVVTWNVPDNLGTPSVPRLQPKIVGSVGAGCAGALGDAVGELLLQSVLVVLAAPFVLAYLAMTHNTVGVADQAELTFMALVAGTGLVVGLLAFAAAPRRGVRFGPLGAQIRRHHLGPEEVVPFERISRFAMVADRDARRRRGAQRERMVAILHYGQQIPLPGFTRRAEGSWDSGKSRAALIARSLDGLVDDLNTRLDAYGAPRAQSPLGPGHRPEH